MGRFNPIVLLGAARSGTKLARDLIALHPTADKVPFGINYVWRIGNQTHEHDALDPTQLTSSAISKIRGYLERWDSGGTVLVEKTVNNTLRVPYVEGVLPRATYIHLVRDGRDVVESARRRWRASPDWGRLARKAMSFPLQYAVRYAFDYSKRTVGRLLHTGESPPPVWGPHYPGLHQDIRERSLLEVCALQWVACVEQALEGLSSIPQERWLTVRYEELVHSPHSKLQEIWQFVGLEPRLADRPDQLNIVTTKNVGKGRRILSSEELARVLPILDRTLQELGYK